MSWKPKDIIALAALLTCGVLLAMGLDTLITWLFAGIISVYVGLDLPGRIKKK